MNYIILGCVILILLLIIIYIFVVYNQLTKIQNRVNEAFATLDVYLKKRWDLVPNLVDVVKSYAKHESTTLAEVMRVRNSVTYDTMKMNEKVEMNNQLAPNLSQLLMITEAYPELKASTNYQDLYQQLVKIEDDIANARKYYNGTIRIMNDKIEMFPSNLVAKIFGFKTLSMFETAKEEKEVVNIQL